MKFLDKFVLGMRLGAQLRQKNAQNGAFVIVPLYETVVQTFLSASSVSRTVFVVPALAGNYRLAGVTAVFTTASTSGTLQLERATGTTALGSGVNQLASALSLAGTANTPVSGTLISSPDTLVAGDRLGLILAGTLTNLAGCCVVVLLERVP